MGQKHVSGAVHSEKDINMIFCCKIQNGTTDPTVTGCPVDQGKAGCEGDNDKNKSFNFLCKSSNDDVNRLKNKTVGKKKKQKKQEFLESNKIKWRENGSFFLGF